MDGPGHRGACPERTHKKEGATMPWFNAKNPSAKDPVMSLLREQAATTCKGVSIALDAIEGHTGIEESRKNVNDIEHEGDEIRAKVVHTLAKAWTTPLDREDLFRFSRSIDDVLDNTRDFVRELHLWQGNAGEHADVALTHVNVALRDLELAMAAEGADMRKYCLEASKESARVRRAYESGLAAVYTGEITMDTLKTRDLLRRIDVIGLRLGESSDAILDGLVKRGL